MRLAVHFPATSFQRARAFRFACQKPFDIARYRGPIQGNIEKCASLFVSAGGLRLPKRFKREVSVVRDPLFVRELVNRLSDESPALKVRHNNAKSAAALWFPFKPPFAKAVTQKTRKPGSASPCLMLRLSVNVLCQRESGRTAWLRGGTVAQALFDLAPPERLKRYRELATEAEAFAASMITEKQRDGYAFDCGRD